MRGRSQPRDFEASVGTDDPAEQPVHTHDIAIHIGIEAGRYGDHAQARRDTGDDESKVGRVTASDRDGVRVPVARRTIVGHAVERDDVVTSGQVLDNQRVVDGDGLPAAVDRRDVPVEIEIAARGAHEEAQSAEGRLRWGIAAR